MFYFRLVLGMLILVVVFHSIGWSEVVELSHFSQFIVRYLLIAGVLIFLDRFLNVCRWYMKTIYSSNKKDIH